MDIFIKMPSPHRPLSTPPPDLLSHQVNASEYFFRPRDTSPNPKYTPTMGGREHCTPDYAISRTSYAFHVMEYVAEGKGRILLNGKSHSLSAGSLITYRPQTHCEIVTDDEYPMVKYFICLSGSDVESRLDDAGLKIEGVVQMATHHEIRPLLEELIREGQGHHRFSARMCSTLLEVILLKIAMLLSLGSHEDPAKDTFTKCKALVDSQAETLRSLKEISQKSGVSTASLCRLFRRYEDLTPYQYLLRRKMHLAATRLVETGALIKEVAASVGFDDPYHFSRCFKDLHKVSPQKFKRTFCHSVATV